MFNEVSGIRVDGLDMNKPESFFELLGNKYSIDTMVHETNKYAKYEINRNRPLHRNSRYKAWKEADSTEMKNFLANCCFFTWDRIICTESIIIGARLPFIG